MSRTRNATRNIIFGVLLRMYQIVVPFFMRTAMIYFMGAEYLGLNSLFVSILQVLNLAELGVGSAMVYSMYKPIANNDKETMCALLKLYRKYYFEIGLVIALNGLLLTPFIPSLIKDDIPGNLNIYILYILNLTGIVIGYWLLGYKNSLLQAHQRSDLLSKVNLITTTVQYGLQLFVLWFFCDYYLYVIVLVLTTALTSIMTALVTAKLYPDYKPDGVLSKEQLHAINQRIKDLFTVKLGATVVESADAVIISSFLGLTVLAMYQNYYFIMSSIMSIITIMLNSCLASIGNSLIVEDIKKNYLNFQVVTFLVNWIVTVCMCCFITMLQPFIVVWLGKVYTFDSLFVVLICIYFYLVTMQQVNGMYKDAAGAWHQDRYRPFIAAIINLLFNLMFVNKWGIYAIVLSTIFSYSFVSIPWMIHNLFKYVFKQDWKRFIKRGIKYFSIACMISGCCFVISKLTLRFSSAIQIILNFIISVVFSNFLIIIIYRKSVYFKQTLDLIDKVTENKLHRFIMMLEK